MSGDRVDFLLFEFQEGRARTGITAVDGSFDPAERSRWTERLGVFVSLPERADRPSTAYLRFDPDVVLLHRSPAFDARQRDSTRTLALIGPPSVLTFTRAALLRDAPIQPDRAAWTGAGYPSAWTQASYPDDVLRWDLKPHRAHLVALVAAIQNGQREWFQFQTELDFGALLLRAAHGCTSGYLQGHQPDWTFSTSPTSERPGARPQFVFGTGDPVRTGQGSSRRRIDLSQRPRDADHAERLVDDWFVHGPHESPSPAYGPVPGQPVRADPVTAPASVWGRPDADRTPADPPPRHTGAVGQRSTYVHAASGEASVHTAPAEDPREHRRASPPSVEDLLPYLTGPYVRLAALWIGSGLFIAVLAVVGGRW